MNALFPRIEDHECPDCSGNGTVFYVNILDPQKDYDESCGTCFTTGLIERITYCGFEQSSMPGRTDLRSASDV